MGKKITMSDMLKSKGLIEDSSAIYIDDPNVDLFENFKRELHFIEEHNIDLTDKQQLSDYLAKSMTPQEQMETLVTGNLPWNNVPAGYDSTEDWSEKMKKSKRYTYRGNGKYLDKETGELTRHCPQVELFNEMIGAALKERLKIDIDDDKFTNKLTVTVSYGSDVIAEKTVELQPRKGLSIDDI